MEAQDGSLVNLMGVGVGWADPNPRSEAASLISWEGCITSVNRSFLV